ncbi:MAG TPA: type VI secretion system baseplate subunit TssG [Terriglobia bacterium]|nr:type VI secretion system baseplate subunit TssG [Terriglobia bacterium]
MASESGTVSIDLTASVVGAKLRQEAFRFDFFQAVRLLEKLLPVRTPVGQFETPAKEVAHFGAHASLAFPASQIQALDWPENGPPRMTVNFMGLTGPEGVLPNPYTSLIIERLRASDRSTRDFLDIFNHRIISLFYQAWSKYRFDAAYGRGERNRFFQELLSLVGLGTDGLQGRQAVPDEALVYYSGLLTQRPRCAENLRQILTDYFDVPVEIEQFAGGWYHLDPDTQCCLSEGASESEQLGLGAVVGDEVWNQQSRVRIILGPLSLERYLDFLPDGSCWEPLQAWVRFFSNQEFDFEVKLILERERVPGCELGADEAAGPRLGWVSWVKSAPFGRDPDDAVLTLEGACAPKSL